MREKKTVLTGRDKDILYTPGRGRNTWTVYFTGKTEEDRSISFIYRLNISSLPFGFRYMRMYDSVLSITYNGEKYLFERDYGEMRKKDQLAFDSFFFQGISSKFHGSLDLLDLTAYITGGGADVAMDFEGKTRMIQDLKPGELYLKHENLKQWLSVGTMDCQGMVILNRKDLNVTGTSLLEKKYTEFPKGRVGKPGMKVTRIYMVPETEDCYYQFYLAEEYSGDNDEMRFSLVDKNDVINIGQNDISDEVKKVWESPHTGNEYAVSRTIKIPSLDLELSVLPEIDDQEVFSPGKRDRVGEYVGKGYFTGTSKGKEIKGTCYIEIG